MLFDTPECIYHYLYVENTQQGQQNAWGLRGLFAIETAVC